MYIHYPKYVLIVLYKIIIIGYLHGIDTVIGSCSIFHMLPFKESSWVSHINLARYFLSINTCEILFLCIFKCSNVTYK